MLIGVISARLGGRKAGVGLALGAGLSFAGTGIAARQLDVPHVFWHIVTDPVALALVAYGVLGILLFATALQRSSVTAVAALVFLVETVVPSAIGLFFLGDHARPHMAAIAVAGIHRDDRRVDRARASAPSRSRARRPRRADAGADGRQSSKFGTDARAFATRSFGSSHSSWRPSAVRSRK